MNQSIQAVYENGILRPLKPLDLPENTVVEIDVRDAASADDERSSTNADKIKAFGEWMNNSDPNAPVLSDEQISRESIYDEQIRRQI